MTALALRGLAARRLRSSLTTVAILLGVAMIAGTYVLTDQMRGAFEDITSTANSGRDVVVRPKSAFDSAFSVAHRELNESLVDEVRAVPGVDKAGGQLFGAASVVVDGRYVRSQAGSMLLTAMPEPFDPTEPASGRDPLHSGEIAVLSSFAKREHIELGDRIGLATRDGVKPVRVVGLLKFGDSPSLGGATFSVITLADAQRWFDRPGQISEIYVTADVGVGADELVRRIERALPSSVEVETGKQNAADEADQVSDTVGRFLTPALLAFAGAALLVGAFIIFNTFSITVAERVREFAALRALGATRGQILTQVAGEALVLALVGSAAGLFGGLGFASLIGSLLKGAGLELPTAAASLAPRTIAVSLAVGIGVTLASALAPALRATRIPPALALQEGARPPASRFARFAPYVSTAVVLLGIALLGFGLFGASPATGRLTTLGLAVFLIFVGVALSARYFVEPLASAVGWPLERVFDTPGELARENAMRNPARTAITAASLMVGLGLVVFVAVFANGIKSSFGASVDRLLRSDLIVQAAGFETIPAGAGPALDRTRGVATSASVVFDQIRVNGKPSNVVTDFVSGTNVERLSRVYRFDWVEGGDEALTRVRGDGALVEEQFAKAHGIEVGERFRIETPSGGSASLRAVAQYRDPQIVQGMVIDSATFAQVSPVEDAVAMFVDGKPGVTPGALRHNVESALKQFPAAEVSDQAEFRASVEDQLDQIVYLLYALLAMSVVVSLFGIANSLFLSIHERTREFGLLRAIGATRAQVRRIVRYESVITAVIGALLGTAIGIAFAWLVTTALADLGLGFTVPFGQLAAFLLLAVVVGVVAAMAPARRGARLNVLRALQQE